MAHLLRRFSMFSCVTQKQQFAVFVMNHQHQNGCFKNNKRFKSTMKAWQIYRYGGLEELQFSSTVKMRNLKSAKDVLIEIHAASVNPIDIAMLGGYGSSTLAAMEKLSCNEYSIYDLPNQLRNMAKIPFTNHPDFPVTLGRDFSGVIVDTGQDVSFYKPGDEVWGVANPVKNHEGTHAEYTVVSTSDLSKKPASVSHSEAASMPYVICTTWAALTVFGNMNEKNAHRKRVLVLGGSGGIGTLAIQLLKCWGAEVTATCATDAINNVLSLGADVAIDYKTHNVLSDLKTVERFDLVLDCVKRKDNTDLGDLMQLLKYNVNAHYVTLNSPLLRNNDSIGFPFGFAKSFVEFGPNMLKYAKEGKHYRWGFYMPNSKALKNVANLIDEGKVTPVIEKVFDFEDLPSAFEKVATGHNRGKTVVKLKSECDGGGDR